MLCGLYLLSHTLTILISSYINHSNSKDVLLRLPSFQLEVPFISTFTITSIIHTLNKESLNEWGYFLVTVLHIKVLVHWLNFHSETKEITCSVNGFSLIEQWFFFESAVNTLNLGVGRGWKWTLHQQIFPETQSLFKPCSLPWYKQWLIFLRPWVVNNL